MKQQPSCNCNKKLQNQTQLQINDEKHSSLDSYLEVSWGSKIVATKTKTKNGE